MRLRDLRAGDLCRVSRSSIPNADAFLPPGETIPCTVEEQVPVRSWDPPGTVERARLKTAGEMVYATKAWHYPPRVWTTWTLPAETECEPCA